MDQQSHPRLLVAIQIIQVANYNQLLNSENRLFYDIYRLYLKTQELILEYTQSVYGTFVSIGNGRFMIFSTNDPVRQQTSAAVDLIERIRKLSGLSVYIGIGYGQTAMEAEKHARVALNHAEASVHDSCIYSVDETGTIGGPLLRPENMSYRYRTENLELTNRLNQANLNIATYEKVVAFQNACSNGTITAVTVAEALGMTDRNARKILASLQQCGLAEVVGIEAPLMRGRPRQIFRVLTLNI